ncbi:MAG: hypothetical protein ACOCWB_02070 [Bacteroidota bacterium]
MTDKKNALKNDFEDSFKKSLKSLGYLFPTSEDDVNAFEENNKIEEVPENYCSASELLSKSNQTSISKRTQTGVNKSTENLAMAARKGGNISESILKKMKSDRDKAENGEE